MRSIRSLQLKTKTGKDQRGQSMIDLILWMILAVIVIGGVATLLISLIQQTGVSARHTQQQSSVLTVLDRISRDVSASNPIVYGDKNQIIVDVTNDDGKTERRRYVLLTTGANAGNIIQQTKGIEKNAPFKLSDWNDVGTTIISEVKVPESGILTYWDGSGSKVEGIFAAKPVDPQINSEKVSRVEIKVKAEIQEGKTVELSTAAVPRYTLSLAPGAEENVNTNVCPIFKATRDTAQKSVTFKWEVTDAASSYELVRDGVLIHSEESGKVGGYTFTYSEADNNVSDQVITYMLRVLTQSGQIVNCIDTIQTVVIQVGTADLGATMDPISTPAAGTPTVAGATNWVSKDQPQTVTIKWKSVSGALGYQISKRPLDSNDNPTAPYQLAYTGNDGFIEPNVTEMTFDVGYDQVWEWKIRVLSKTGNNDNSVPVRTHSYPAPVTTLAVKAETYEQNRLNWTYNFNEVSDSEIGANFTGFDIYRSGLDTPNSGFTKIASVPRAAKTYLDTKAELGSRYGYYIAAKNYAGVYNGVRGGFSNSFDSEKVEQLQFPPDPTMVGVSSGGSRDYDRYNYIAWNAAKSASGYHVERSVYGSNAQSCVTSANCAINSGGTTALNRTDNNTSIVTPNSQINYVAFAYNATGVSPKLGANILLTQRPAAPQITVTQNPENAANGYNSPDTELSWTQTASNFEYVRKDIRGTVLNRNEGNIIKNKWGYTPAVDNWGRTFDFEIRAKNAAITNGGFSDTSSRRTNAYPGPFSVQHTRGDTWGNNTQRYIFNSSFVTSNTNETDHALRELGAAYTTVAWSNAAGGREVAVERVGGWGSAVNGDPQYYLPNSHTMRSNYTVGDGKNRYSALASPGTEYDAKVVVGSVDNGLTRTVNAANSILTPADIPQGGYVQSVCEGPWDVPPYWIRAGQDAAMYARSSWNQQSNGSRLVGFDKTPRYGHYSSTVVAGKYQNSANIARTYNWYDQFGNGYTIEEMRKGSINHYQTGNVATPNWDQGMDAFTSNSIGNSTHRYIAGHGFQIYNRLNNDPALNSYWMFVLLDVGATRGGCGDGAYAEPYDACYEWNGNGECTALNQNGRDGRPRWNSR